MQRFSTENVSSASPLSEQIQKLSDGNLSFHFFFGWALLDQSAYLGNMEGITYVTDHMRMWCVSTFLVSYPDLFLANPARDLVTRLGPCFSSQWAVNTNSSQSGWGHQQCGRHEPCKGVWGYPPSENFQVWRLRNAISALVMRYVSEKSTSNHENYKQLQISIIKITESKENKSIHRRDLSGSTGLGGSSCPPCPPLATALRTFC